MGDGFQVFGMAVSILAGAGLLAGAVWLAVMARETRDGLERAETERYRESSYNRKEHWNYVRRIEALEKKQNGKI